MKYSIRNIVVAVIVLVLILWAIFAIANRTSTVTTITDEATSTVAEVFSATPDVNVTVDVASSTLKK